MYKHDGASRANVATENGMAHVASAANADAKSTSRPHCENASYMCCWIRVTRDKTLLGSCTRTVQYVTVQMYTESLVAYLKVRSSMANAMVHVIQMANAGVTLA